MSASKGILSYTLVSITAQVVTCAGLWILTLAFSPMFNSAFEAMVYLYWPLIALFAAILGSEGEGTMLSLPLLGMLVGIVVYGAIVGLIISILKRRLSAHDL